MSPYDFIKKYGIDRLEAKGVDVSLLHDRILCKLVDEKKIKLVDGYPNNGGNIPTYGLYARVGTSEYNIYCTDGLMDIRQFLSRVGYHKATSKACTSNPCGDEITLPNGGGETVIGIVGSRGKSCISGDSGYDDLLLLLI